MARGKVVGAKASTPAVSELDALRAEIEGLKSQLAGRTSTSGRTYAPTATPRSVADELLALPSLTKEQEKEAVRRYQIALAAEGLRDIAQLMVKRVPGSKVDATHPYGQPELVWNKARTSQMNAMKDGVDRGTFIKLRNLVDQMGGDFDYNSPRVPTDDQINKVVLPALDEAVKLGIFEIESA